MLVGALEGAGGGCCFGCPPPDEAVAQYVSRELGRCAGG